jgi:multidrug efflux pump subunit AcrA (membrane-fusion protein)
VARSIDPKTRTMPVELETPNTSGALAPGMYAQVNWPVRSTGAALMVPSTSIVRTTERLFVIRVRDGRAEWVDVRPGARDGNQVQVLGNLAAGDVIVLRGSDEIRDGAPITVEPLKPS